MPPTNTPMFSETDRVLLLVSDTTIHGTTRLQKYGFLLHKQYEQELSAISRDNPVLRFYDDWKPFRFGPYSESLSEDVRTCVDTGHIYKELANPALNSYRYSLTIRGRMRWRHMLNEFQQETTAIHEKIMHLQGIALVRILEGVYKAYPEYTTQSEIKDKLA